MSTPRVTLEFHDVAPENAVPAIDAATILFLRDAQDEVEVFCVERAKASPFMGGALVFPGGKLEDSDRGQRWATLVEEAMSPRWEAVQTSVEHGRALGVAACREAIEEGCILPTAPRPARPPELAELRSRLQAAPDALAEFLAAANLRLDLRSLIPFARWVTPYRETRRFDARFFLARAPVGQEGAHDNTETTRSLWDSPAALLRRYERGDIALAPPTHRILEILAAYSCVDEAVSAPVCLEVVCPELVKQTDAAGETIALVLPGDPEHSVREVRAPGRSRYVLRYDRWLAEDAPRS